MKYRIDRTSDEGKPCEEAFTDEEVFIGDDGKVGILTHWYININTLEELQLLVKKYGYLIIGEYDDGEPDIEIYDDYRE
jgi:hypothetical protein